MKPIQPAQSRGALHAGLFLATCVSTFGVFLVLFGGGVDGSTEDKLWGSRVIGVGHPPVVDPGIPLSRGRKVVVVITWVMTGLTFMPIPLSLA